MSNMALEAEHQIPFHLLLPQAKHLRLNFLEYNQPIPPMGLQQL
jgi:hypothetical protein